MVAWRKSKMQGRKSKKSFMGMTARMNDSPSGKTQLQGEEAAYPNGAQRRKGKAIFPDGTVKTVYAGIPDTFFTIPAHTTMKGKRIKGYLSLDNEGEYIFHINKEQ